LGGYPAGVGVGLHVALGAAHVDAGGEVLGAGDGRLEIGGARGWVQLRRPRTVLPALVTLARVQPPSVLPV
jgi:hypothetical protein